MQKFHANIGLSFNINTLQIQEFFFFLSLCLYLSILVAIFFFLTYFFLVIRLSLIFALVNAQYLIDK